MERAHSAAQATPTIADNPAVRVNNLRAELQNICEELASLTKDGIKVDFQIVDNKLVMFRAFSEMKLTS